MSTQNISQRLSNFVRVAFANRRGGGRLAITLPIQFSIVCLKKGTVIDQTRKVLTRTVDISRNGLAFDITAIRIDGMHMTFCPDSSTTKHLEIELVLPERAVQMKGVPIRYNRKDGNGKFVVGIKIAAMPAEDRRIYEAFLKARQAIALSK